MDTKKNCSKCRTEKPLDQFYNQKGCFLGRRPECKACQAKQKAEYRQNNKEQIAEQKAEYRQNNKEKIAEYYQNNKEQKAKQMAEYRQNNKEKIAEQNSEYYQNNKEQIAEQKAEYRQNNKEKIAEQKAEYRQNNKEQIAEQKAEYQAKRLKTDPLFKLKRNISTLIHMSLSNNGFAKEGTRTREILGCDIPTFNAHLEAQFWPGMSRDNKGGKNGWDLDHKIPVSTGKSWEEIIKLNHYTNFQPLWHDDNMTKSDNADWDPRTSNHLLPSWLKKAT